MTERSPAQQQAYDAWVASDSARILSDTALSEVYSAVLDSAKALQAKVPELIPLKDSVYLQLDEILCERPFYTWEENGETRFECLAAYLFWRPLILNLRAYACTGAALSKTLGSFESAKHWISAELPLAMKFQHTDWPIKPFSEEETRIILDGLAEGEKELQLLMEYHEHLTFEDIRKGIEHEPAAS